MDSSDITKSILIFVVFLGINFFILFSIGLKSIRDDWPKYKCNPVVMPFAKFFGKDPITNFESCIQNIQNIHMGSLLDPLYHTMGLVSNIGEEIMQGVLGFSGILNLLKFNLGGIANLAVEIVINILIEMQALLIKFKDMINKLVGVFVTFIYLIAGTQTTALTIWQGLPGWILKEIAKFTDNSKK
uniref:Uncharacterized protein n=1 Tax=Nucleocytoviricota sp. TaxID=2809609 RepID=A0A9E8G4L4_9VIRU|nr:hypothetical protein [Nucleocytoviricota sp.]UZT29283.1 hypothetical protein [Nucleocytoviricota sp.]